MTTTATNGGRSMLEALQHAYHLIPDRNADATATLTSIIRATWNAIDEGRIELSADALERRRQITAALRKPLARLHCRAMAVIAAFPSQHRTNVIAPTWTLIASASRVLDDLITDVAEHELTRLAPPATR